MKIFRIIIAILTLIAAFIYFTSSDEDIKSIAFTCEMIGVILQIFIV